MSAFSEKIKVAGGGGGEAGGPTRFFVVLSCQ